MATYQSDNPKVNAQAEAAFKALIGDRTVAYQVAFAKAFNSVTAGLLVSQFAYWSFRTQDPDGWFYKTQAEIFDELGLTRYEQETARKTLKKSGVLQEKVRGVPSKLYFRIDITKLLAAVGSYQTKGNKSPGSTGEPESSPGSTTEITAQDAGNQHPRLGDSNILGWGIPTSKDDGFQPAITETTAEITSQTTRHNFEISNGKSSDDTGMADPGVGGASPRSEPAAIGQLLPQVGTRLNLSNRGRPPKATPAIEAYVIQFSQEFHDEEHLKSNVTRAMRICRASGLDEDAFIQMIFEARSITKQQGNINKQAIHSLALKNRMPYFFTVLEDIIGTKPHPYTPNLRVAVAAQDEGSEDQAQVANTVIEQQLLQEEAELRLKEQASKALAREYPPQEIPGTELTTETAWRNTLALLEHGMTPANYQTWLKETRLVFCDESTATIVAPSPFVVQWLATRFKLLVEKQLEQVLGFRVSTKYLALSELQ